MKQTTLILIGILLITHYGVTLAEKVSPTTRGAVITSSQSAPVQQNMEQVALVIGNNDYEFSPLENAVNDATKVAGVLKQKGFKVILKTNLTYARMKEAVREFENELAAKKDVGLLFYAGHGVQIKGENFLIPVNNQEMRDEMDVQDKAINVDDITQRMTQSKVKLSVVILDACRDNPFKPTATRSRSMGMTRGLTPMQAAEGMVIAYATDPGSTASDGDGGQGLYTSYLVETLQEPGLEIEKVFKEVSRKVKAASKGKQKPWYNASIEGTFCFGGCQDQLKIMEDAIRERLLKEQQQQIEQQRISAEKAAAVKEAENKQKQQLAEQQRIAAKEAESKQKQQLAEQKRIAAEKTAAAKEAESKQKQQLAEQQRIAAEKAAAKEAESKQKQQLAEQQRIAAEKAAAKEVESKQKQQLVEQQRIAAEKAAAAKETEESKPEATKPQPTVNNSTPLPPAEPSSPELVEPVPEVEVKPQKSRGLEVPTGGF